jgi:beta-lactamase class A
VKPYVRSLVYVPGERRVRLVRLGLVSTVLLFLAGAAMLAAVAGGLLMAAPEAVERAALASPSALPVSTASTAAKASTAPPPGPDGRMLAELQATIASTRARVGVTVVDLSYSRPRRTELNANATFVAASTYKFVALMANAERIAAGSFKPGDRLCFRPGEAEDGWFHDYRSGQCYSRQTLAARAGQYSDNTAGHMLVDSIGGGRALNSYAKSRGAVRSAFYYPNQTTAADLASLWTAEAQGQAGGQAAQQWLYPLLTQTAFERGVPAGVPSSARVVHKVGWIDSTVNDAALVTGPNARYVVVITTDGLGGDPGWALVSRLSAVIWKNTAN